MKILIVFLLLSVSCAAGRSKKSDEVKKRQFPSRTEIITPIHKNEFRADSCPKRIQGGNPRMLGGILLFDGAADGNRQVDPQIAVGGGYVLNGTNLGLTIYDKQGNYIDGVSQNCFNRGIDPKMFYDMHNRVFGFDLWWYWDSLKVKPVNIAISETDNPLRAWNIYPVPAPEGVDGGGIGFSRKWIGYSFPGGEDNTFVMKMEDAIAGKPAKVYHFKGSLGQPVFTQDRIDDLYFFKIVEDRFVITRITENNKGVPVAEIVSDTPHGLKYIDFPPKSPQKGTEQLTASGDRNPKNIIFQSGSLWFSQAVNVDGRSAVQWNQVKPDGKIVQTGLISSPTSSYIQTTIAVNSQEDVLVGFQKTGSDIFISPRMTYRLAEDSPGTMRDIISLGEGEGATGGTSWGDYSGSTVDGDDMTNLWTIQSRANKEGRGETVIAKFIQR